MTKYPVEMTFPFFSFSTALHYHIIIPVSLFTVQDSLRGSIVDVLSQALFRVNGRIIQDEGDPLVAKTKKTDQQAIEKGVRLDILTRQV